MVDDEKYDDICIEKKELKYIDVLVGPICHITSEYFIDESVVVKFDTFLGIEGKCDKYNLKRFYFINYAECIDFCITYKAVENELAVTKKRDPKYSELLRKKEQLITFLENRLAYKSIALNLGDDWGLQELIRFDYKRFITEDQWSGVIDTAKINKSQYVNKREKQKAKEKAKKARKGKRIKKYVTKQKIRAGLKQKKQEKQEKQKSAKKNDFDM